MFIIRYREFGRWDKSVNPFSRVCKAIYSLLEGHFKSEHIIAHVHIIIHRGILVYEQVAPVLSRVSAAVDSVTESHATESGL